MKKPLIIISAYLKKVEERYNRKQPEYTGSGVTYDESRKPSVYYHLAAWTRVGANRQPYLRVSINEIDREEHLRKKEERLAKNKRPTADPYF